MRAHYKSPRPPLTTTGMLALNILGTAATIFTTKADLQAAVQEYDANSTDAIATYGPIAGWDVSAITDMSLLFYELRNFNADISSWEPGTRPA